jgi:hypothetical protein
LFPGDVEQQNYLRFLIQAAAIKAAAAAAGDARQQQCGKHRQPSGMRDKKQSMVSAD